MTILLTILFDNDDTIDNTNDAWLLCYAGGGRVGVYGGEGGGGSSGYVCSNGLCIGETGRAQIYAYACECELVEEGCACGSGCSIQEYWGMSKGRLRQGTG